MRYLVFGLYSGCTDLQSQFITQSQPTQFEFSKQFGILLENWTQWLQCSYSHETELYRYKQTINLQEIPGNNGLDLLVLLLVSGGC